MTNDTPKPEVEESSSYVNYMDSEDRFNDQYNVSLDRFFGEPIKPALADATKAKRKNTSDWKAIYVHINTLEDMVDFCKVINQMIPGTVRETYYPLHDPDVSVVSVDDTPVTIDPALLISKFKDDDEVSTLDGVEISLEEAKWKAHWKGMPDFEQEHNHAFRSIIMKFRKKEHFKEFAKRIGQDLSDKTKSIRHPKLNITKNMLLRWIQPEGRTLPKYPLYIVSKGRADTMMTSRSLSRMQVPHYIVIEPQDHEAYDKALDKFGIRPYVTLIVAPFSNHGDGPGRARNYAWDHSISIGATSHWVLDDNIADFYRLHQNQRIRIESGVFFQMMEDFVDRYDNIYIAGPQYRFFIPSDKKNPPFVVNTRVYSTLLIRNDCKHRWRGRYNEDTDICLRVLKDGDVCLQFYAFLQGKAATQSVKGGNTAEFYHAEFAENEEFEKSGYNSLGTVNKSQMLVDMHPDVARLVWRYDRWHHYVDYSSFRDTEMRLKPGVVLPECNNNYGMKLITDFKE